MRSNTRRLGFFMVVCLLAGVVQVNAFAAGFTDIGGHWAQQTIQALADDGIITGKGDGTFQPNANITRAEYFTLVNKVFGFEREVDITFRDVSANDWFAAQIRRAAAAGYISGYEDNTIKPNANITRAEVSVVLTKLLSLPSAPGASDKFYDAGSIPGWAKQYVDAAANAGLINGYPDGSFQAGNKLTRAEAAALTSNVQKQLGGTRTGTVQDDSVLTITRTYGSQNDVETISKDVRIANGGITLRNVIIQGDLTIDASSGTVTLKNVTVEGTIYVINGAVDMDGNAAHVVLSKADSKFNLYSGKIDVMDVESTATGSRIFVAKDAVIGRLNADAVCHLTGAGRIEEAMLNVTGVTADRGMIKSYITGSNTAVINNGGSGGGGGGSYGGGSSGGSSSGWYPTPTPAPTPVPTPQPQQGEISAHVDLTRTLVQPDILGIGFVDVYLKDSVMDVVESVTVLGYTAEFYDGKFTYVSDNRLYDPKAANSAAEKQRVLESIVVTLKTVTIDTTSTTVNFSSSFGGTNAYIVLNSPSDPSNPVPTNLTRLDVKVNGKTANYVNSEGKYITTMSGRTAPETVTVTIMCNGETMLQDSLDVANLDQ